MDPEEHYQDDFDYEDDDGFEAEDWDEETLGFEDDADADSLAREIGLRP
ncbi:MAG TPA: hypothetical protein VFB08_04300 [Burkholderiales bacterium]|nr:hypothetical protein [Burkholderiales bacterium]